MNQTSEPPARTDFKNPILPLTWMLSLSSLPIPILLFWLSMSTTAEGFNPDTAGGGIDMMLMGLFQTVAVLALPIWLFAVCFGGARISWRVHALQALIYFAGWALHDPAVTRLSSLGYPTKYL